MNKFAIAASVVTSSMTWKVSIVRNAGATSFAESLDCVQRWSHIVQGRNLDRGVVVVG